MFPEFLKPPNRIVAVVGRYPRKLDEPIKPRGPEYFEPFVKPLRRKLLFQQILYWSCVAVVMFGVVATGLKLLR